MSLATDLHLTCFAKSKEAAMDLLLARSGMTKSNCRLSCLGLRLGNPHETQVVPPKHAELAAGEVAEGLSPGRDRLDDPPRPKP